jgi:hypothetical protein
MADVNNPKVEKKEQPEVAKKRANPLVIIFLLFILLFLGSLVYLFLTDKVMVVGLENPFVGDGQDQENVVIEDEGGEDVVVEENEDDPEATEDRDIILADDNAYYNSTIGISLDYPDGWEISEESLSYIKNLTNGEVKDISLELSIVSEDKSTIFDYEVPFGSGHEFCVFEDSLDLVEGTLQNEYEGYMEYEGEDYIYRIAQVDALLRPVCKCKRREGGVGCNNWMNPGYVSFGLEGGADDTHLMELFDILESIEYTGDIYKAANKASSIL